MQYAGQLLQERSNLHKVGIDSLALNPDSNLVATGGADRTLQLCSYPLQVTPPQNC